MRSTAQRITVSSILAGALVLGAAGAYASGTDLTGHGDARRLSGDQTSAVKAEVKGGKAKNVILLIGDGMGDSEITIARNYAYGAAGRLPGIDAMPMTGQYTTYSLDPSNGKPDYVTDSAASGSGWATGTKTYNGAISVDVDGVAQKSILEIAKANGLRTGDVSTAELQDATPAVLVSHVTSRSCYSPTSTAAKCPTNALENGGAGSITEQLLDARPDVTLGGGAASFADTARAGQWKGKTLAAQATARGFQVVDDAAGLDAVTRADQTKPVLGLFTAGNMPTVWQGPAATRTGGTEPAVTCTENPAHTSEVPTLEAMTTKAIDLLDAPGAKKGFFLQVEGASIDKQDHAANPCAQIGETVDFDHAVSTALEFAKADGNTLVVVTADHGHSSQIVYPNSTTPGLTRTLTTVDGQPMTIAYGTADEGGSQDHTGTQVRVAGYGPGAANVVGLTDQTDLFFTMRDALRLDDSLDLPGAPEIRNVSVSDGAVLSGRKKIVVTLDASPKYTYIELNKAGVWKTDNTKAPGSTNAGSKPTLVIDTRDYPNGTYGLKIDAVGIDGRTTEKTISFEIRNR
ncbi:alkaline phosphatase [Sediminihabitans luteus]|uniref:Alkaline phosphatase n=1 Tax=Sediminihabitans luteus TaxID=1138585 RepID=A0A2M9CQM5_9CELL|nr:alkaline phosphatase [Sediminihabitans luteus]PJJ74240.1 alkaline phosphatase [Sediminihabitans luteus]GII99093.1 alkaline phosphatase [Sediminihabitans luteus]